MQIEYTLDMVSEESSFLHYLIERHGERVGKIARILGEELGLSEHDLDLLQRAGELHDKGKYNMPTDVLFKVGLLTDEEKEVVKLHPIYSVSYAKNEPYADELYPIILHHHENWDGSGYPTGLSGKDIPLLARVLRIADEFDALIEPRPYRDCLPLSSVLEVMESDMVLFDKDIYKVFKNIAARTYKLMYSKIQDDQNIYRVLKLLKEL